MPIEVLLVEDNIGDVRLTQEAFRPVSKLNINPVDYRLPFSKTFAHAVDYYRTSYPLNYLRDSTFSKGKEPPFSQKG
jgi:hypothetical protein